MTDDIKILKSEIKRLKKTISDLSPSLNAMLKQRGFTIYKKEPSDDLLVPDKRYAAAFYNMLKKYSFRLFLRDVIKHQKSFTLEKVTKYATREVSAQYLDFILKSNLARSSGKGYRLVKIPDSSTDNKVRRTAIDPLRFIGCCYLSIE